MKRILAILLAALMLLTGLAAAQAADAQQMLAVRMTELADAASGSTLAVFEAPEGAPLDEMKRMALDMQIEARFAQKEALAMLSRAGVQIAQAGRLYQDEGIVSMARTWQGDQPSGRGGSSAAALTVNLETGMEIYLDELFADAPAAIAAMEAIIERDVLDGMSDYMEFSDLLPMPTDSFFVDEGGLTIYYPEDRYRYFDGESGSVSFYWHELADYIAEDSPAYALANPDVPYSRSGIETACSSGLISPMLPIELGDLLGEVMQDVPLADPDYTTDALVYPLERERGFAVEIPKYAETDEEETPVSAIRASRIGFCGLLKTGVTTDVEVLQLMGEPARETVYDEDAAFDAMLDPGTSLMYEVEGRVLQLHIGEDGVLSCVILRSDYPMELL